MLAYPILRLLIAGRARGGHRLSPGVERTDYTAFLTAFEAADVKG
jgi:hypothetical protein